MSKKIPVEVYSRVVGYFQPISHYNPGKQEEFRERHYLDMNKIEKITKEDNNEEN